MLMVYSLQNRIYPCEYGVYQYQYLLRIDNVFKVL